MLFPCLAFSILKKSMGVKHTVLPDGQLPTVAITVLVQLRGPQVNEREMGVALFTKNGEGRTLTVIPPYIFLDGNYKNNRMRAVTAWQRSSAEKTLFQFSKCHIANLKAGVSKGRPASSVIEYISKQIETKKQM